MSETEETENSQNSQNDAEIDKEVTISKPIKSALKKPVDKPTKPAIKRTVSFAPGLITGKSDISEILSSEEDDNVNKKVIPFDDASIDHNDEPITKQSLNSLNFTNFKFGGTRFSGSETSDDEKDFGKLNKKYQTWSRQWEKQQETKEKMEQKLKQSVRKLRKTKKNIKKLKQDIENDDDKQDEEDDDEDDDIASNSNNSNTNNSNQRKRRRRSHKSESIESSYKKWKKKQNKKGVIYISSVPFGCTSVQLKKIFNEFGIVTNVHMEAAKGENGSIKKIYNKWTEFCEAWIEFKDKKIAKQVVELLNETKIPKKYVKNKLAKSHIWNMKYLKGFGWHHLTEYKQTIRTLQRKKYDLAVADAHRQTEYFKSQVLRAQNMTKNWNKFSNDNNNDDDNEKQEEEYYESSDDDLPPMKIRRTVQQRSVRKRRNHQRNNKDLKQMANNLMK